VTVIPDSIFCIYSRNVQTEFCIYSQASEHFSNTAIIFLLLKYLPSFGIHVESFYRVDSHTLAVTPNNQNHVLDYSHSKITPGVFHTWDGTPMIHFCIQSFDTS